MLDTSYGFNNLLKEVTHSPLRDTNISLVSKKSSSKTSTPAKKYAPKSKDLSVPSVTLPYTSKLYPLFLLPSASVETKRERQEDLGKDFGLF